MQCEKRVEDVMNSIFDYPHIPYWFSIRQAIKTVRVSLPGCSDKNHGPFSVLVFDEKYRLLGTLSLQDIMKGLEPRFFKPVKGFDSHEEDFTSLSVIWDSLFLNQSKELSEKQVSEIMAPAEYFIEPDDPLTKAAYFMLKNNLVLLPVLENRRKLVGLVRMVEIFDAISDEVLKH
jgi:CBS-domain-containing membrane protein